MERTSDICITDKRIPFIKLVNKSLPNGKIEAA